MSNVSQSSVVAGRRIIVVILTALLLWAGGAVPSAQAAVGLRVDLKVLLISNGGSQTAALAKLMDREGVPYDTVDLADSGRSEITAATLEDAAAGHGFYQAIVLPNREGIRLDNSAGLSLAELAALASYERRYGVRQVNAYQFPGAPTGQTTPSHTGGLDGAAATVTSAGLDGPFSYLNGELEIDDFDPSVEYFEVYGYLAEPLSPLPADATFTSLVDATYGAHHGAIIGVYEHDLREELVITASYNADQEWFNTVAHGILTWMTRGIHLGYQRNYLNVQIDDVFLPDSRWNSDANCTPGDTPTCPDLAPEFADIRMTAADVADLDAWQIANNFTMDMVFNAEGSVYAISQSPTSTDLLTNAFLDAKNQFTWVNHTYTHTFLGCIQLEPTPPLNTDWKCAKTGDVGPYYDPSLVPTHETTIGNIQ